MSNSSEKTKKCPKCQEEIQYMAKKCKHCGADTRNWFARHKIITGIAAIVLLSAVGSAFSSGSDKVSPQESASSENSTTNTKEQDAVEYAVGDTVTVGNFSYKIEKVETESIVGTQYTQEQATGQFKIITLVARNNDSQPRTLDSSLFRLKDADGREYSYSTSAQTALELQSGASSLFLKQMQPGLEETAIIVFDIPKDAHDLKLSVSGGFLSGKSALIRLE